MKVKIKITAIHRIDGVIRYTIQTKFKWWQRYQYVYDGRCARLFSSEELQLLGIKK